jgi:NAD(P)-dependent dehydrogenase (short-subunit alcohol dehydrogenase family)
MTELGFDGKVAIITGAGGGLGRQHALLLASRGALVVVNDLGGAVDGSGSDKGAAEHVVDEIRALGGEAVADANSVSTPEGGKLAALGGRPAGPPIFAHPAPRREPEALRARAPWGYAPRW